MDNMVTSLIGAAWVAIFAMLVWGVVSGWRRQLRDDDASLPLFALMEREGVSPVQLEASFGAGELARAAARCATCATKVACQTGVLRGWLGAYPEGCPNATLFHRARGLKTVAS